MKGEITEEKEAFAGDEYLHYLDCQMDSQVYTYVKTYQLYTLNIHSVLCINDTSIKVFFEKIT